jgi:hypothetical protein
MPLKFAMASLDMVRMDGHHDVLHWLHFDEERGNSIVQKKLVFGAIHTFVTEAVPVAIGHCNRPNNRYLRRSMDIGIIAPEMGEKKAKKTDFNFQGFHSLSTLVNGSKKNKTKTIKYRKATVHNRENPMQSISGLFHFRENVACFGSILSSVSENDPLIRPHLLCSTSYHLYT